MTLIDKQKTSIDPYRADEEPSAAVETQTAKGSPGLDQSWIISRLVENVERAMGDPALDADGKSSGRSSYQGAVANRALELLGKHYGLFTERVDVHYHHEEALEALE